jgi:large subunit ribosomal protein L29
MDAEKIRNLTDVELQHQQRELNDQLFRLKFQLKMGQTESLKKIRGLRKDVARVKTIIRQKELGIAGPIAGSGRSTGAAGAAESAPAPAIRKAKPAVAKKKAAAQKGPAKKVSGKKAGAKKATAKAAAKTRKK